MGYNKAREMSVCVWKGGGHIDTQPVFLFFFFFKTELREESNTIGPLA